MVPHTRRLLLAHGRSTVTVRGTVTEIRKRVTIRGWRRIFKSDTPAAICVTMDEEPHRELNAFLRQVQGDEFRGHITRIRVIPGDEDVLPPLGTRLWLTYYYANCTESFFEGAPLLRLKGITPVTTESAVMPDELATQEYVVFPI